MRPLSLSGHSCCLLSGPSLGRKKGPGVTAHIFNPWQLGGKGKKISQFEVSLIYIASYRDLKVT